MMASTRKLLTSTHNTIDIDIDDPIVKQHWENPNNVADIVLDIFNTQRFFDSFFVGKKDLIVLDIGGNVGLFSLYIQDRAKAVYTLEPTKDHFDVLSKMVERYDNIHPLNVALNNEDALIDFYISSNNTTMNSIIELDGEKVTVQGKTLATLISELNLDVVDFVKIDIEGSEMIALNDETVSAVKDKIKMWNVEVHSTIPNNNNNNNKNENLNHMMDLFSRQGYKVYRHEDDCVCACKE